MLAREAGGEWDPASLWTPRWSPVGHSVMSVPAVDAEELVLPTLQGRGERVGVCLCVCAQGVLFNVYISTIYTLWSWGPYISSIPCLGQQGGAGGLRILQGTLGGWLRARVQQGERS